MKTTAYSISHQGSEGGEATYDCSFSTDDFDTSENIARGVSNRSAVLAAHRHAASNGIFDYEIRAGGPAQQFERGKTPTEDQSLVMK